MTTKPWPREVGGRTVEKVFRQDASPGYVWFVSSRSVTGCWRRVQFHQTGQVRYWTCSCPAGWDGELKMGSQFGALCSHVKAIAAAEKDDGSTARSLPPTNAGALVD